LSSSITLLSPLSGSNQRRIQRISFVTFVESNAKSTFDSRSVHQKLPLRPAGGARRPVDVCSAPTEAERRPFPSYGRGCSSRRLHPKSSTFGSQRLHSTQSFPPVLP